MPKSEQTRRRIAAAGGEARFYALTPERRSEIARMGYQAMLRKRAQKAAAAPPEPTPSPLENEPEGSAEGAAEGSAEGSAA